jgi:hypothetical protein
MFEFKMSYKETGFHNKPGDKPFIFPPDQISSRLNGNLIEIEGGNGSGKTTLLNCLALALGYLDEDKELEHKKALLRKLENLERNLTLSYLFDISSDKPEPTTLKMERKEGQQERIWLNSMSVDLDHLRNEFDVVFLTEDDPKKVVSASLGKLAEYFKTMDGRSISLNNAVYNNIRSIKEFKDFEKEEKQLKTEIAGCEEKIKESQKALDELKQSLKNVQARDDIKGKIALFAEQNTIISEYENLKTKFEDMKAKQEPELMRQLQREKMNLNNVDLDIKNLDGQITRICTSLKLYGTILESQKILENDFTDYNALKAKLSELEEKATKMQLVDDMIQLFERYQRDEIVPVLDKPVHEAVNELIQIKRTFGDDRIFGLMNSLEIAIERRRSFLTDFEKIQEKIAQLGKKIKNLEGFDAVQREFSNAENKYLELQNSLQQKSKLTSMWSTLCFVKGEAEKIGGQIQTLEAQLQSEERLKSRFSEKLRLLNDNATKKPKFVDKEKALTDLYEATIRIQSVAAQWIRILETPAEKNPKANLVKGAGVFGIADYNRFVKAVGEFLGSQFEPVDYNYKLHDIKFFDIERNVFITKEDRQIHIDELSQGQSKVSVLRKVFKEMNPSKRKIVLIDEIADLDAANMQFVRDTLKQKFEEGSLFLAVLVRPCPGISSNIVELKSWG